ncbi:MULTISPECIES: DUF397 domain-containing protein [Streptomyces]|uniref:DUF397 domain-containing protein n=1 Tax=Streptomyces TaxID=1883 RepID=UPI00163D2DD4|nr:MULTISPECIES: DUF397 domain-containing protein [Streptomyces]MBC2876401.1 DUF397 domain-containing protein [Streptomyces sp. TYQ1024]UBI35384.1 DUF397 domain-containing protein [Streptomyces mobaraensis]UKW27975.1 DUF397 domain-containing protein [Streptomyces sp. TYQ1024]
MSAPSRYVPSRPVLRAAEWRRSSHSTGMNNCVEAAVLAGGGLAVRDSKRPAGPWMVVGAAAWRPFVTLLRAPTGAVRYGPSLPCPSH